MSISVIVGNEVYIYMNGHLIHKTRIGNPGSGVTFNIRSYRKCDSLRSIT